MAELIAASVRECSRVARLSPGVAGEVATYLVGRRVIGVRLREAIEIHVVARYGVPLEALAAEVRAAITPVAPGFTVDVYVDDVDVEPATDAPCGHDAPGDPRTASGR